MGIDLAQLLLLGLASLVLCAASCRGFRGNATTRRVFVAGGVALFVVLPALVLAGVPRWELGVAVVVATTGATQAPEVLLWLVLGISAGLCGRVFSHWLRERRALRILPPLRDARVERFVGELRCRLGLRRAVRVRVGRSPCASSLGGATLVLPAAALAWPDTTLRSVLAHELVHIARRDDALLVLGRLCTAIYWYLPWMALVRRNLEQAIEESCDDVAAALVGSETDYLASLLAAARRQVSSALPALGGHPLVARFARFAQARPIEVCSHGLYWGWVGLTLGMFLLLTVEPVRHAEIRDDLTRVVAIASPNPSLGFDLKLATEDRGPPRVPMR